MPFAAALTARQRLAADFSGWAAGTEGGCGALYGAAQDMC
jgi:hypothetical protein